MLQYIMAGGYLKEAIYKAELDISVSIHKISALNSLKEKYSQMKNHNKAPTKMSVS